MFHSPDVFSRAGPYGHTANAAGCRTANARPDGSGESFSAAALGRTQPPCYAII